MIETDARPVRKQKPAARYTESRGFVTVAGVCDPGPASQRPATEDTDQHDSVLHRERARPDAEVAAEFADLGAVQLALAGQHFGDGRFGDPGFLRGLRLRDALGLDQQPQHVRVADWFDGNGFVLVGFDQIAEHVEVVLLGRGEFVLVDEGINDGDGRVEVGVGAQRPEREPADGIHESLLLTKGLPQIT